MVGKSKHNGQHSTHIGSFVKHNGSYFDQVRGEGWPAGGRGPAIGAWGRSAGRGGLQGV
jgi:hypothetical protein